MKSIIKRNVLVLWQKKNIFLVSIALTSIYLLLLINSDKEIIENLYFVITGTSKYYHLFQIIALSLVINFSFILYTVYIYTMYYNYEAIFLRISQAKWMLSNLISIAITDILILLIMYVLLIIFKIYVYNDDLNITFSNIATIFISKLIIQNIFILGMKIISNFSLFFIGIFVIYPLILKTKSVVYIQNYIEQPGINIILMVILILLVIINIIYTNQNFILRREKKNVY